jgi:hypothetical protein
MAEQDSTTKPEAQAGLRWSGPEVQELISILRTIRAAGDLLCAASVAQETYTLHADTLVDLGSHLEDLAAEGLVILRYDSPKEEAEPQAAGQGGE